MAIVVNKSQRWRVWAAHLFLVCLCVAVIFPFLMVISISLRPGNYATGSIIPSSISLEHWRFALGMDIPGPDGTMVKPDLPVLRWLWNSIKVATVSACIGLFLSTTAAYAFARLKFAGKKAALMGLMLMQMFPSILTLVAIHSIFTRIGNAFPVFGMDSLWSLVLAYSGGIALHIWTIKGFYETIPAEIEEAATVDGATPWQAFWRVLLPMALPILMVVFLLAFIGAIIEYPVASILLHSQRNLTLAVGANSFLYPQKYMWGDFAAAAILSGLPITLVFMLAQKGLIAGLTSGGTKG
ncbi:MAG TPA: maltose ABC transporter permease MalG [Holophaga sp.]|nr:maltose ABC transporter permease MalG [Holophaga sp.]